VNEYDGDFQAYGVPTEGAEPEGDFEDAEGYGYGEDDIEGYDADALEELGVIDEYGQVDEDRLADVIENLRAVHNDQATLAGLQQDKELEQVAQDLENRHPVLRDEQGTYAMLDAAAEHRSMNSWASSRG
jgi:hypothetical protein